MVDVRKEGLVAQAFEDREMISPNNIPAGLLEIVSVDLVQVKKGISMGQRKIVVGLKIDDKLYGYWPNKTANADLEKRFGSETDGWIGKKIELTAENIMVQGKKMQTIIVK